MKDRIKNYFTYSKKEQRGLIVLLGLMLLSIAANFLLPALIPEKQFDIKPFQLEVEQFLATVKKADSTSGLKKFIYYNDVKEPVASVLAPFLSSPFYFDPNTLSEDDWIKMGMDNKVTRNILRYREKGGKFRDSDGFRRIYGMNDEIFSILEPYLKFEATGKSSQEIVKNEKKYDNSAAVEKYEKGPAAEKIQVELNSADSATLLSLNGIGPSFAGRIIKSRDRLGGFYKKEQLLEIKGMDSLRYNQFISQVNADTGIVRKIDLNKVTFKELMRHPYFEYYLVKAIFSKKDEIEKYDSVEQLKHLPVMYEELYNKIEPYLEVE